MTTPSDRSETPRTDAGYRAHYAEHLNNIQLCRALERELAAAQALVVELESMNAIYKEDCTELHDTDLAWAQREMRERDAMIDQLRAELTLAQQDTARLDKLQQLALANGECWIQRVDKAGTLRLCWGQDELPIGIDLRAAIDAALAGQPKDAQ